LSEFLKKFWIVMVCGLDLAQSFVRLVIRLSGMATDTEMQLRMRLLDSRHVGK